MKKVLHILNGLGSGGAESFAINSLLALEGKDIKIDFLIRSNKGNIYLDVVKNKKSNVIVAPEFPRSFIKNYIYMKSFFKGELFNYDIVHIHSNSLVYMIPLYLLNRLQKKVKPKIIIHSHNTQAHGKISRIIHKVNKKKLDESKITAVACSDLAGKWMFKESYQVIANGVNLSSFQYNTVIRDDVRKELGIQENEILIGNVGRLTNQKNHMLLLKIFNELCIKHSNYKLILVGDGELRTEIEKKIDDYKLGDKVIMTGAVTNIHKMYQAMDIFLMTSFYEGLPVSLIEAQAAGLSIIVPSEAVGRDANILNKIKYLSLNDKINDWILEVEKLSGTYNRTVSLQKIEDTGFGLTGLRDQLCSIYEC